MPSPIANAELIDTIVREVIRRLTAMGAVIESDGGTKGTSVSAVQEVVVGERLITLETLRGRLSGARRVVVGKSAVVTPAVRDELRDREIELHFGDGS